MTDKACDICSGTGWVCENHRDTPWMVDGEEVCGCGGCGKNCVCNPNGEADFLEYVYASIEPEKVKSWVQ